MTNTNTKHTVSFKYDLTECNRCGGSGHYSRCSDPEWGTLCFMCGKSGSPGMMLTKEAQAAKKAIGDFRAARLNMRTADLKIGDEINVTSMRAGTAKRGKSCKLTVRGFERGSFGTYPAGYVITHTPADQAAIVWCRAVVGDVQTVNVQGEFVERIPNDADITAIAAFARTLKGVTVTEK